MARPSEYKIQKTDRREYEERQRPSISIYVDWGRFPVAYVGQSKIESQRRIPAYVSAISKASPLNSGDSFSVLRLGVPLGFNDVA